MPAKALRPKAPPLPPPLGAGDGAGAVDADAPFSSPSPLLAGSFPPAEGAVAVALKVVAAAVVVTAGVEAGVTAVGGTAVVEVDVAAAVAGDEEDTVDELGVARPAPHVMPPKAEGAGAGAGAALAAGRRPPPHPPIPKPNG